MRIRPSISTPTIIAAICALTLASCSSSSKAGSPANPGSSGSSATTAASSQYPPIPPGPIKLGLSASLSGPLAEYGIQAKTAFTQVALPYFNQTHPNGIDGHKLELDLENDAGDATTGVNIARQMISNGDAAVIKVSDIPSIAALQLPILNKAKMPVISQQAVDAYANTQAWPYTFSVVASDAQIGQVTAKWIAAQGSQYQRIALLTDNVPVDVETTNDILNPLKTLAPSDTLVKTVSIAPGAADATTQIAQLKAASPDLVLVWISEGFGAVWNAFNAIGWDPDVIAYAGAYYSGLSSLGALGAHAYAPSEDCVPTADTTFPANLTSLMNSYAAAVGTISPNMLVYVEVDSIELELVNYAITKYNSISPAAIKAAMESMTDQSFIWSGFSFTYSPTNHYGLSASSDAGPHMCDMTGLSNGKLQIPVFAPGQ